MENTTLVITTEENVNWEKVYDQLLPRVFHFFFYKVGDNLIAEELTTLTFEKAWTNRSHYKKNLGEFHFWVFGIAKKVAADYFRGRRNDISIDSIALHSSQNVEREVEKKVDTTQLVTILQMLPERERLLVSLKYGAELNNREIARQTGLSESNVGTILFRAVEKLRQEWEI